LSGILVAFYLLYYWVDLSCVAPYFNFYNLFLYCFLQVYQLLPFI